MARSATLSQLLLAVSMVCLATLGGASAERFKCPDNLSDGGGAFSDDISSVEYRSWGWEKDTRHYLCHCVRNLHRNPIKIEWLDVGLKGWVRLNASAFAMSSAETGAFETRPSELKLGRVSVVVNTLFRATTAQSGYHEQATVQPAAMLVAQDSPDEPVSEYSTVSEASISVPAMQTISGLTIDEIDAAIQDSPYLLQDVEMTFTSVVDEETGEVRYECRYGVLDPSADSSFLLKIDDPEVHAAVFGSEEPQYVDWSQFSRGEDVVMSGAVKIVASADELITKTTAMSFVDDYGTILGSMPIRFLAER